MTNKIIKETKKDLERRKIMNNKITRGTKEELKHSKIEPNTPVFATDVNAFWGGNVGKGIKTKSGVKWLDKENKYYQVNHKDDNYVEIISAPNYQEAKKIGAGLGLVENYIDLRVSAVKNGSDFFYGETQLPFTVRSKGISKTFFETGKVPFDLFIKELHNLNQIEIEWGSITEIFEMLEIDLPNDFKTYSLIELNEIIEWR